MGPFLLFARLFFALSFALCLGLSSTGCLLATSKLARRQTGWQASWPTKRRLPSSLGSSLLFYVRTLLSARPHTHTSTHTNRPEGSISFQAASAAGRGGPSKPLCSGRPLGAALWHCGVARAGGQPIAAVCLAAAQARQSKPSQQINIISALLSTALLNGALWGALPASRPLHTAHCTWTVGRPLPKCCAGMHAMGALIGPACLHLLVSLPALGLLSGDGSIIGRKV